MRDPEKLKAFDVGAFLARHNKSIRGPEVFAAAKALKAELGYKKVGVIGFCYGGWAAFQLGGKGGAEYLPHAVLRWTLAYFCIGHNLVDAISVAHPSMVEEAEVDAVSVPVQILAPQHDPIFNPGLKEYCNKVIPTLGVEYDYQYFPNLAHGFATRGDPHNPVQKKGLERAKNAAVLWFVQHLHN